MENLIGKEIPDFKVDVYHSGDFKEVSKKDIKGKWSVFFFYPADFTFVCPTELGDLSDHYETFKKIGCEVYSVSEDTHFVHKAWADASETVKRIKYPMIGDPNGFLAKFFGVLVENEGKTLRGSFVVDPDCIIRAYEVHDMGIGRNAEELIRKVEAAKFVREHGDQVCPANWKPGAKTLKPGIDLVGKI